MLLLLEGCAPLDDAWTRTRDLCGVTTHDWDDLGRNVATDGAPVAAFQSVDMDEDCATAIVQDFGGDPEKLLADPVYGDTLVDELDGDLDDMTQALGLSMLLLGGWWLLGDNAGTVGQLEADDWTDPAFVAEVTRVNDALGGDDDSPLAQVLYDYAAHAIVGVRLDDRRDPGLQWGSWILGLPQTLDTSAPIDLDPGGPLSMATLLVHESRHHTFSGHLHTRCGDLTDGVGEHACDDDLTGGYGFTQATFAAYAHSGACDARWPLARSQELAWKLHLNLEWPGSPCDE